ncbi:hypothetical protein CPLU01_09170 [Colletotrichum plurivorum]|uniref:Uncharacterized protein n=1 Tax=Colletotrichum plurivorum TaxID=2175906 RepID=A0A8H6K9Q0_9PEZI|nr:hypothetical protein CPLU01_09170 [Colletotrichum plurivorum]
MPPIQIHSASPINASKATGSTPKTEEAQAQGGSHNAPGLSQTQVGAIASSTTPQQPYPPAQPGAAPSLPVQTASAQAYPVPRPTPTSTTDDVSQPPPPQPGAVPVPGSVAAKSTLPPPPKAGETYQPPAPTPATVPYPPQMSIPPPTMSHAAQRGSSTSVAPTGPHLAGPQPIPLAGDPASSLEHPPGYQQDVSASEFNSHQRAAHNAAVASAAERGPQTQSDEGVWDAAKKWAQAAGGTLAAAEQEVWRRINKD